MYVCGYWEERGENLTSFLAVPRGTRLQAKYLLVGSHCKLSQEIILNSFRASEQPGGRSTNHRYDVPYI
jgi:hypothetical protein